MAGKTLERSLALIGGGYWGKNLARNYNALGVLHTLCDIDQQQLVSFREVYPHVRLVSDPREIFSDPVIKRVAIATWPHAHFALVDQALRAGKDVFVEKPLCLDLQGGRQLVNLARERELILMVGHVLQYHPCMRRLQDMADRGELGRLQYIASHRLNLGKIRTVENALWSLAPHDLSVILGLSSGKMPTQVRCVGGAFLSEGVADTCLATLSFPGGMRAHIYVSWLNPFKEQKLTVVGSEAMVVFDDRLPWEQKLSIYRQPVEWSGDGAPQAGCSEPCFFEVPQVEPLLEECRHFLDCCETRNTPRTDGEEALRGLTVLEAAQISLKQGGKALGPVFSYEVDPPLKKLGFV